MVSRVFGGELPDVIVRMADAPAMRRLAVVGMRCGCDQASISLRTGEHAVLAVRGRNDPCIAPRALPCVEAAVWIALADMVPCVEAAAWIVLADMVAHD